MTDKPTRGERLNNPGNIDRNATHWQGMAADQSADPRFVVFTAPEFGIRALCKVLLSYYRQHGLKTVFDLIGRWAPPGENDTGAYVAHVADSLVVAPDAVINVDDVDTLEALAKAIITYENGRCIYSDAVLTKAVTAALT